MLGVIYPFIIGGCSEPFDIEGGGRSGSSSLTTGVIDEAGGVVRMIETSAADVGATLDIWNIRRMSKFIQLQGKYTYRGELPEPALLSLCNQLLHLLDLLLLRMQSRG